ncbi:MULTISPECIES: hypothetical protein [Mesonia]|uniref:Uncharacterized protein n=1 Tax=Mesonia oceanica TaxID=2687242 RepID=A0AC61Y5U4_9FLAO|nr:MULTISPECIES: hypothetical protein [Mesonia]MAN28296.1 hypothetical protein [Mesonia sp.]MAQ39756.1 hypothetical protein [Mesonia sp.]VVU99880.1 hypothetical protein FVB9532_01141 [Mesonia oceanica]|tara:strand:+ start:74 stop:301 length:228 start_codon:yes stop_codon:yes gene_type:complete
MDMKTRKLNLISYLAHIQDETILDKIEKYILENNEFKVKPLSVKELLNRIEISEKDFKNKKFKTQTELEIMSENW